MAGTRDSLDSMAPWDAAPYFQQVREQVITAGGGAATQVCGADPNRVALMFGTDAVACTLTMNPAAVSGQGIQLAASNPPVLMRFSETGPLCQQAWYALAGFNAQVTVYEILLTRWPKARTDNEPVRRTAVATKPANGSRQRR